jgi:hypothetical protein
MTDHVEPVGVIENGPFVPGLRDCKNALGIHVADGRSGVRRTGCTDLAGGGKRLHQVLFEAEEIAHLRGLRNGRQQPYVLAGDERRLVAGSAADEGPGEIQRLIARLRHGQHARQPGR